MKIRHLIAVLTLAPLVTLAPAASAEELRPCEDLIGGSVEYPSQEDAGKIRVTLVLNEKDVLSTPECDGVTYVATVTRWGAGSVETAESKDTGPFLAAGSTDTVDRYEADPLSDSFGRWYVSFTVDFADSTTTRWCIRAESTKAGSVLDHRPGDAQRLCIDPRAGGGTGGGSISSM